MTRTPRTYPTSIAITHADATRDEVYRRSIREEAARYTREMQGLPDPAATPPTPAVRPKVKVVRAPASPQAAATPEPARTIPKGAIVVPEAEWNVLMRAVNFTVKNQPEETSK